MAKIGRPGLPESERRRIWEHWKQGKSYSEISRTVGVPPGSVFSILKPRGGIYFPEPKPRPNALTVSEREEISRGIAAGESVRQIARTVGKAASTISREIKKNKGPQSYRAVDAQDRAIRQTRRPQRLKLQKNPVLRNYVSARLERYWSPEQIAGRLRLDYPANTRMHVSHEAVYRAVYLNASRKILPHGIHHCLRRHRPIRHGRHYSTRGQWRSQIKQATPIGQRPDAAETREELGHWEGDLVLGSRTTQVATLVDRASRRVHLLQLADRTAKCVRTQLTDYLRQRPEITMKSLTWDRGMELAEHQDISRDTHIEIFFADPRSPWKRGTNENTNGLVRQYLPKKTTMAEHRLIWDIAEQLNTRPRKTLGYRTPLEAEQAGVALTS